jgi:Spy/CpxP family protein refolding chaperone
LLIEKASDLTSGQILSVESLCPTAPKELRIMRLSQVTALTLTGLTLATGLVIGVSAAIEPSRAEIAQTEPTEPNISPVPETEPVEPIDPSASEPEPSDSSAFDSEPSSPELITPAPRRQRRMRAQERWNEDTYPSGIGSSDPNSISPDSSSPSWRNRQQRGNPQGRQRNAFRNLNLSPEQRQRLQEVRQQYGGDLRERRETARQAREELRSLRNSGASPEQIQSQARELRQAQQAVREIRTKQQLAMREILTPQQWRRLNKDMRNRKLAKGANRQRRLNDSYDYPKRQPTPSEPPDYSDSERQPAPSEPSDYSDPTTY